MNLSQDYIICNIPNDFQNLNARCTVNQHQLKLEAKMNSTDLLSFILRTSFQSRMQFLEERDKEIGLLIEHGHSVQSSLKPLQLAISNQLKQKNNQIHQKLRNSSKTKHNYSQSKSKTGDALHQKSESGHDQKKMISNNSIYNKKDKDYTSKRNQIPEISTSNHNTSNSRRKTSQAEAQKTMSPNSSTLRQKLNLKVNNQENYSKRSQASSTNKERPASSLRSSNKKLKVSPTPLKTIQPSGNKEKCFDKCDFENISYINTNDNLSQMSEFSNNKDQCAPRKKTPFRQQAKDIKVNTPKDLNIRIEDSESISQQRDTRGAKSTTSNLKSIKGSTSNINSYTLGNTGIISSKGKIKSGRLSRNSSKEKTLIMSNNQSQASNQKFSEKRILHSLISSDLRRNNKADAKSGSLNEDSFLNVSTILQVNDIISKDKLNEDMLISNINDSFSIQNTSQVFLNRVSNYSLNSSIIKPPHSTKSSIDLGFPQLHFSKSFDPSVKPFALDSNAATSVCLNKLINNNLHIYNTKCLKYLSSQDLVSVSSLSRRYRKLIFGFYFKEKMNEINFVKNLYSKITLQTDGLNNIDTFQKVYVYNDAAKQALKLLNEENCILAFKEQIQKGFSRDSQMLFKIILILILGNKSTGVEPKQVVSILHGIFQEAQYRMGLVISSAVDKRSTQDFWVLKKIFFLILGRESSINPHNFSKTCATSGLISVFLKDLLGNLGLIYDVKVNNIKSHIEFVVKLLHILEEEKGQVERIYKSLS